MKGMTYSFKVVAVNGIGDSLPSQAVSVIAADYPDQILTLEVASQSPTEVKVQWTAPYDGGAPITSYSVYWDNGFESTFSFKAQVTGLSYSTTDVVAGSTYRIKVLATNDVGDSSLSPALAIMAASRPDAPALPTMISQEVTALQFTWSEPDGNFDPVTDYKVYWD